jgi:multidrug efflux pump subunit AcrB
MQRDLIPSMEFKLVTISSTLIGASAVDVERYVTFPIEESIKNLADIEKITSYTRNSSSSITVYFKAQTKDVEAAVNEIKDRITSIKADLPKDIKPIDVRRIKVDSVDSFDISITGIDELKDTDRNWADALEEKILKIPGIIKIESSMRQRKIYIDFDEKKTLAYGLSIPMVRRKLHTALAFTPVSQLTRKDKTISIELKRRINAIEDIANTPLAANRSGNVVKLKDIADVRFKFPKQTFFKYFNAENYIQFEVHKDTESDIITLGDKIHKILKDFDKKLPKHIKMKMTGDGASFVQKQLDVLRNNGLTGFILVGLTLYILLGFRISFMTSIGVPLSYLGTFIVLQQLGIAIDLISVVGMILVIGILVDDAIIVSEQYVQNLEDGQKPLDAAINAAHSTIIPVTGTVLTTLVAFAPILFIESEVSKILYAIPCVIIASLSISWFESFFILPNHLQHFVKSKSKKADGKMFKKLKHIYQGVLAKCLKWRYVLLITLLVFSGFSAYFAGSKIEKKWNLRIGNKSVRIYAILKESTSPEETLNKLKPVHDYLKTLSKEDSDYFSTRIGRIWLNHRKKVGNKYASIKVNIPQEVDKPSDVAKKLEKLIGEKLKTLKTKDFKDLYVKTLMKGDEKNKDDIITVFVSGGDKISFTELQTEVQKSLKTVKNVESVFIDEDRMQTSWQFIPNEEKLVQYGISKNILAAQLRDFFSEEELTHVRLNGENTTIYTKFRSNKEVEYKDLKNLKILGQSDVTLPVSFLGRWENYQALKSIEHKNLERKFEIDVRYDLKDKDGEKTNRDNIVKSLEEALKPVKEKNPTYNFSVEKVSEQEEKSKAWMMKIALFCIGGILLVLMLVLGSTIQPFLVAFAIPFGIIGIIWALYFHGMPMGIMVIIGLIGMAGVVVNDSLIMVDVINKVKGLGNLNRREAIIEGASARLRPILITTITTLGGVFPMAYGLGGESGFTQPLAFSMGWGLTFATTLTLFVLPALLEITEDFKSISIRFLKLIRVLK